MKLRLQLILLVALLLQPLSLFLPETASADVVADAKQYCASIGNNPTTTAGTACMKGYGQEKKNEAQGGLTKTGVCGTGGGTTVQACYDGWDGAKSGSKPSSSDAVLTALISTVCYSYTGNDYSSCKAGVTGQKHNQSQSASCSSAADKEVCKNSWTAAKSRVNPSSASSEAKTACEGKTGSSRIACIAGYQAGKGNASNDNTCDSYTGSAKSDCKKAYTQGKATLETESGAATATDNKQLGCDASITSPLTWVICPVVDIMVDFIETLDGWITSQLEVDTSQIFCEASQDKTGSCQGYYEAWQAFRNIALGLLVAVALVILISQAVGMEILDAYTIRKTLPRLLIAVVGITLSWPLMQFLIDLTNFVGYGIRVLIYAPFKDVGGELSLSLGNGIGGLLGGLGTTAGAAVGAVGGWIVFGGPAAMLAWVGTAMLAVFVAFFVLAVRQIAIIMMLVLAPVAIVLSILPNTQKYYKLWWESFSKALLMFPLISAFIASGRVFSAVALQNPKPINQIIGFLAYFAPYFLIPLTFKMAGSFVGQIGGLVNERSSGMFGALGKRRAEARKQRTENFNQKFRAGEFHNVVPERFDKTRKAYGGVIGATNAVGRRVGSGVIRGGFGFGERGRTAKDTLLMEAAEAASKERAMAEGAKFNAFGRLMAYTAGHNGDVAAAEADLRKWYSSDKNEYGEKITGAALESKVAEAKGMMANAGGYTPGRAAAAVLGMGRDGTAIRDVEDMGQLAAMVSEGSETMAYNLISQVGSDSKRLGRGELAPSQMKKGALAEAAVKRQLGMIGEEDYRQVVDEATMAGAGGQTGSDAMRDAPERVIRANAEHAMDIIQRYQGESEQIAAGSLTEADRSVKFDTAAQAAGVIRNLQAGAQGPYAKGDNKIALNKALSADGKTAGVSRQQELDSFLKTTTPSGADGVKPERITNNRGERAAGPRREQESVGAYVNRIHGNSPASEGEMIYQNDAARRRADEASKPPDEK